MVKPERFCFEYPYRKYGKNRQTYYFLYQLELKQAKWASLILKPNSIGWHLKTVLEKSNEPTDKNNTKQAPLIQQFCAIEL